MPPLDRYYPFLLGMGLILSPLNFATALLLFVGFDLADLNRYRRGRTFSRLPFRLAPVLVLSGLSFLLWGMVSLLHVPASGLAETTVGHIVAARNILGEPGARIMGVARRSGSKRLVFFYSPTAYRPPS